ncbi:methylated-DNA--[protein]-cysteine S-methyltransferase [Aquimarina intermedia]|uniref:methylated-DNA--[protein]-cysteine S-methyltransferase n=1 Tax=Aquimarina intermedia TaxID=350814 RepID=A0A5S5C008_9FLAO|nr:methylated-DNA--[protein]-cysteine S-methyltransferase [Aquimarina intermedia]TYP72765.1 AraC family transcriptional regulator of adaptative response/methylated-DNA-[protein]-cysteine methyltransferase [Aquimarina intermedia]
MTEQKHINYERIAKAIRYLVSNYTEQPDLAVLASQVHMSPHHFQRIFTQWAGTSPKKFLQYISIEHAKAILRQEQATVLDTTIMTGLSSSSRLHDLFVSIEGMTPAEYKNEGKSLSLYVDSISSPFGTLLIAATQKGICHLAFKTGETTQIETIRNDFPQATIIKARNQLHAQAEAFFTDQKVTNKVPLHIKGTNFQLKVWEALLKIPQGQLTTYGAIAKSIQQPRAARAVGTAIGSNPVAFLIPCHRVIQASGVLGGYRWGPTKKATLIGWEHANQEKPITL